MRRRKKRPPHDPRDLTENAYTALTNLPRTLLISLALNFMMMTSQKTLIIFYIMKFTPYFLGIDRARLSLQRGRTPPEPYRPGVHRITD